MPRFSIIITCYNQRDFIKEAVDSALVQSIADREIIVVDDGSVDGSIGLLERYMPAITFRQIGTNQGVAQARNEGASIARGDFLVFLDGDDLLMPWALDVYSRVADLKNPKLILAKMHFFSGYPQLEEIGDRPRDVKIVDYECYFGKDRGFRASASAMVIDRAAFATAGEWTPGAFPVDDQDLLFKLGCSGRTIQIVTPETTAYRVHEKNVIHDRRRLIEASHFLLRQERKGCYPGGRRRRLARHSAIGGFAFFLLKIAWKSRFFKEGIKLLVAGWPFVIAAIIRRGLVWLTGRRPTETFRHPFGRSPSA